CGDDTSSGEDDGGAGGGNTPPPGDQIDLLADTNRDGLVDTFDNAGEELWTVERGAVFLPNLDDDNNDGVRDAENDWIDLTDVDGQMVPVDRADMATMRIAP